MALSETSDVPQSNHELSVWNAQEIVTSRKFTAGDLRISATLQGVRGFPEVS